jgi:Na+-transporting NADH:ubiquinone oxidoreductase subunit F
MRSAVVVRKLHKWLALIVGAQALVWVLTGVYMTAVHIDIIHGDHFIKTPDPAPIDPSTLAAPQPLIEATPGATALRLIRLLDRPIYVVEGSGPPGLFDARSGERLPPPTEAAIRRVALDRYGGAGDIAKIKLLDEVPPEIRGRAAPVWRVEFDHWNKPTLYLSPHTGELLTRRHELWRIFDFAWMLHIMDYETREDVNNPLLRVATIAAASMALTGAALLIWSFPKRQRRESKALAMPRLSPLFFRRVHKWVGLVLGVQFVLWAASGAGMSILDHDKVMGHGGEHAAHIARLGSDVVTPARLSDALVGNAIISLTLRPLRDRIVYEVGTLTGHRLIDARTARKLIIDAPLARSIAEHDSGSAKVLGVTRVAEPTLETRDHQGPSWRVDFAGADGLAVYVSEATGEVIERRTDTWRLFDVLWMLHTMDYVGRDNFNHPLIVVVAFGVLWLVGTGVYLIFKSFRRSDLGWLALRR